MEYFRGSPPGERVRELLESREVLFTPSVCLAELKAKYLREGHDPVDRLRFIKSRSSIVVVDAAVAEEAADLKLRHTLHMVDALVLSCARAQESELVTGDPRFDGIPGVMMLSR